MAGINIACHAIPHFWTLFAVRVYFADHWWDKPGWESPANTSGLGEQRCCLCHVYQSQASQEEQSVWRASSCWEGEEESIPTCRGATRAERVEENSVLHMHPDRAAKNGQPPYFKATV